MGSANAGTTIGVAGTIISAQGELAAGDAAVRAAQFRATQYRSAAGQAQAAGQVAGEEELRKMELMQSRIIAVAGASGAGALDPTVVDLVANTAKEGKLAQAMRIYNADEEARGLRMQSSATIYEGDQAQNASRYRAASTVLQGASRFAGGFSGHKDTPSKATAGSGLALNKD